MEMLVVISIFLLLVVGSIETYVQVKVNESLYAISGEIADAARRAELKSQAVDGDSQWGFHVNAAQVIVFKGASYASRTVSSDETYQFPSSVVLTGTVEYIYAKMTGMPNTTGTITIALSGKSKTLSINAQGIITQ
jgi:hypothetical protein